MEKARKPKSPYQRYQKTEFRYSEFYRRWKSDPSSRTAAEHNRYLRDILGWKPDPLALERMPDEQSRFWRHFRQAA